MNATSHWLHGDAAARTAEPDLAHTGVGGLTHVVAAAVWALPLAVLQARRPPRSAAQSLRDAAITAAIAAAVDYGLTPKRFTPGWELVLPPRALIPAYGALAIGLALGAAGGRRMAAPDGGGPTSRPAGA